MKNNMKIKGYILYPTSLLFLAAILLGLISPEKFYNVETAIVKATMDWLGWLFGLTTIVMLVFCLFIFFSKKGDIILGGKDAQPLVSKTAWWSITLCGGIASGIVFWGIAEPLTHFAKPIPGLAINPFTEAAAISAIGTTIIHWTIPYYVFYTICGIAVGYSCYNMKLDYCISSTLYPLFGEKVKGIIGKLVDLVCLFGIAGGISAVLGVIAMQTASGFNFLFGLEANSFLRAMILIMIVIMFLISSYTGLNKGIKILSDINARIFLFFMAFVFLFGGTKFILSLTWEGFGYALDNFFTRITYLSTIEKKAWPQWWTVIYYAWAVAYGPMMGMFLGKIAKGRSLKEFVTANFFLPALFNLLWFGVFGSAAIKFEMEGLKLWEQIDHLGIEAAVFIFFNHLPLGSFFSFLFILVACLSVVTLADSITTTVSALSMDMGDNVEAEPPNRMKIYWAFIMASLAFVNILSASTTGEIAGIDATKQLVIATSGPLLILCILQTFSVYKMIKNHTDTAESPKN